MKIKQIKVYQAVRFDGKQETLFNSPEFVKAANIPGGTTLETIVEMEHGFMLLSAKSAVLIGRANVAYIEYDRESVKAALEPAKPSKAK